MQKAYPEWAKKDALPGHGQASLTPYTLHPTPYTLHPTPYTLHPAPYTLHPTPYTLHSTPYTLHPTPSTLEPEHEAQPGEGALRVERSRLKRSSHTKSETIFVNQLSILFHRSVLRYFLCVALRAISPPKFISERKILVSG